MRQIRSERTVENYSRGAELVTAIKKMRRGFTSRTTNDEINKQIEELLTEYDLTHDEWYYWSEVGLTS